MTLKAYNTGTIELMPYPEYGEFCIVGIFAVDTENRAVHYRLQDTVKTKRLTGFFPELDRKLFLRTLTSVHDEWKQLTDQVNQGEHTPELTNAQYFDGHGIFQAIVHPREGMIRHKQRGTILSKDIDAWLKTAFTKMVLRVDLTHALQPEEQKLTNHVASLLRDWKVEKAWKEGKVGRDDYHATFPFTYKQHGGEIVERAIKPLFLGQETTTKIIDHGDTWLQKVRRLRQFKLAPETLIFPVQRPLDNDPQKQEHAEIIINDFIKEGVHVIESSNITELKNYARIDHADDTPLFAGKHA